MEVSEVYAINIQRKQIASRIKCSPDDKESIERERVRFLNFLRQKESEGMIFSSQNNAWDVYDNIEPYLLYEDLSLERATVKTSLQRKLGSFNNEFFDVDNNIGWLEEISETLYNEANKPINLANYTPLDTIENVKSRGIRIKRNTKFAQQ